MSFASMPLYTGDYLRDTRHLTPLKHGIYLLALMHCWDSKGPMPLDEQECAGICNCRSSDEIAAMRYVLDRYFVRMEDGHYNERITKEVERSAAISSKRANAGRDGAHARHALQRLANAKQMPGKSQTSADQLLGKSTSPSPSLSPTKEELPTSEVLGTPRKRSEPARGTRLPEDWALSKACGDWAMKESGFDASRVRVEAAKFSNHWWAESGAKASKRDWSAAWRTWILKAMTMPQQNQSRQQADVAGITVPSRAAEATNEYLSRPTPTPDEIRAAAARNRESVARATGRAA